MTLRVLGNEHLFVRGRIVLPVRDAGEDFEWGVWVSLSKANFIRMADVYEPTTLDLKTNLHT